MTDFDRPLEPELLPLGQRQDFFLSHRSAIKPTVRRIAQLMREEGLSYWFDEQHALPNKDSIREISQGLASSDFLIVFIDPGVTNSGWVLSELASRIQNPDSYLLVLVDYPIEQWMREKPEILSRHPVELANDDVRFIKQLRIIKENAALQPLAIDENKSIQDEFEEWSRFGQGDSATIQGVKIELPVVTNILGTLAVGLSVLTGGPGSGKSGVLRSAFEQWSGPKVFLKMDLLLELDRLPNLELLVSQSSRLALAQPVAIFIDSLDVLSNHRQTKQFKATLKLLDDLSDRPNILVLIACREFDLDFDPVLKERKWVEKFKVDDLHFDSQVAPLLDKLSCAHPDGETLRKLICVPQYLGLYVHLHQLYPEMKVATSHDLFHHYLEQLVERNSELGPAAVTALESMASTLLERRQNTIASPIFTAVGSIQKLRSLNLLKAPFPDRLGFAHQTWQEFFAVRAAVRKSHSLLEFILSQDQLPHCRAYIRSYFEHMTRQDDYLAQVRAALTSDQVTFHIKRLLVASLGQIEVADQALSLVTLLAKNQLELLQALFKSLRTLSWLRLLNDRWLETAWSEASRVQQLLWFLGNLDAFTDTAPELTLKLTLRGLNERPELRGNLTFLSYRILIAEPIARLPESRQLMEWYLLNDKDNGLLDAYLADWLRHRRPDDDDLLWEFLQIPDPDGKPVLAGLPFSRQHFGFPDGFLAQRFSAGDLLKDRLLDLLDSTTPVEEDSTNFLILDWHLLDSSSYMHKRHEGMALHSCLDQIFVAFEAGLALAAQNDTMWWKNNHQRLQNSKLEVLNYFHLRAVLAASERQAAIAIELSQKVDCIKSHFHWEWTQLLNAVYPKLDWEQMEEQQRLLLGHANRAQVAIAVKAIPACYRGPEAQAVLDDFDGLHKLPEGPDITSKSGWVRSPVSTNQLATLSINGVFKLLGYYQLNGFQPSDWEERSFIGNKVQFIQALRSAASDNPALFLPHISKFQVDPEIFWSVLEGLSDSLRFEAGTLNAGQPRNSLSQLDCNHFCDFVVELQQDYQSDRRYPRLLLSCSDAPLSPEHLESLMTTLQRLAEPETPNVSGPGVAQILTVAINSPKGVAVECALNILCRQVTDKMTVNSDLVDYLTKTCEEENTALCALVLRHLPAITWHAPQLGWALFELCETSAVKNGLWQLVESNLHWGCKADPDRVAQTLDKYLRGHLPQCGAMLGRITALMVLDKTRSWEQLYAQAESHPEIWNGAAEVFAKNLPAGLPHLVSLMTSSPSHASNSKELDHWIFSKENRTKIPTSLVKTYLNATSQRPRNRLEARGITEWLEYISQTDPDGALEVIFVLDKSLDLQSDSATNLLMVLLREVDDRNDPEFTRAVLRVQDMLEKQQPAVLDRLGGF